MERTLSVDGRGMLGQVKAQDFGLFWLQKDLGKSLMFQHNLPYFPCNFPMKHMKLAIKRWMSPRFQPYLSHGSVAAPGGLDNRSCRILRGVAVLEQRCGNYTEALWLLRNYL